MNGRLFNPNGKAYMCGGLDTYTEECLYILCSSSGEKMEIFYAWQANKTKFISVLSTIEFEFQHYSLHDQSHARAIIESIEMFLGKDRISHLGIGDLWLLLNCAYSHDIGMAIKNEELLKIWCSDKFKEYVQKELKNSESSLKKELHYLYQLDNIIRNSAQMDGLDQETVGKLEYANDWPVHVRKYVANISAEYIRSRHAERSKEYLDDFMNKYRDSLGAQVTEKRLYNVMGEIAYSHSMDGQYILEHLKYETNGFGNEKIHPQFIAALLGLGDLLDMDNNRFDKANIEHFGELPALSETHMKKHLAISHLRITEYEIEAVAESTEFDVCVEAQKWFDWLEKSVKFITANWNKLAPKELDGCIFRDCSLSIFLNGNRFENDVSKRFSIDQKKAFKLFIGDQLYGSKQVWIREYIQNALDATKMMLWIRGKEGMGVFTDGGKELKYVSPLDLNQNVLNDYGITIKLELLGAQHGQKEEDFFRISIIDKGIGIEKECIQAISEVGAGWRKRTSYQEEITEMPEWLKPTGGFGIGIQAGFMVSDKVHIESSGLRDNKGYQIELHSPKTGGDISIIEKPRQQVCGTTISLEMSIERASECYGYNDSVEIIESDGEFDCFNYNELLHKMYYSICEEVGKTVRNSLIPISIMAYEEDGNRYNPQNRIQSKEYVKSYLNIVQSDLMKKNLMFTEPILESSCEIVYDDKEAWIWDGDREILLQLTYSDERIADRNCSIDKKETNEKLYKCTYFFKGIYTYFYEQPKVARVPQIGIKIDFLGYQAGDCLLASRDAFSKDFKGWMNIREYLHLFCRFLADKCERHDTYARMIAKYDGIQYLFVWDALFYGGNTHIEKLVSCDIAVKAQKLMPSDNYAIVESKDITLDSVYKTLKNKNELIIFGFKGNEKARDESISVFYRKEELKSSGNEKKQEGQVGVWYDENVEDTLMGGKVYYTSQLIYEMLLEYEQFQARIVTLIEQPVRYWYIKEWTRERKGIGNSLSTALVKAYNEEQIYIVVDKEKNKFSEIAVQSPPLYQKQADTKLYKEADVILLPFIKSAYLMLGSRSGAKIVNKEEFIRRVQEGRQWLKAVNWTMHKHKGKAYITRSQIEKKYTELCEMLYDIAEFENRKNINNINAT